MHNNNVIESKDRTAFAIPFAIVMVLVGTIPAGIVVVIYKYFLASYTGGSWVPFFDSFVNLWFPELLRGIVCGAVAIAATQYLFKTCKLDTVRYATLTFWCGILLAIGLFSIAIRGLTFDLIGLAAVAMGLGTSLLSTDL